MKKIQHSRLIHTIGLLFAALLWLANSANPPTGNTGAPFNGHCENCHGGNNSNGYFGTVTVDGMPATVQPNIVYPLTLTMTPTGGNPVRGGFQLVAVDGNNANAGLLAPVNAQTGTDGLGGRTYLEHRGPKNFAGNPVSWNFNWTAPASAAGNAIKFYFIGNFVDGNGGTDGDRPLDFLETYAFAGPPPLSATISATSNVSCNGGNTGSATVQATGGNPPYSYLWSNNQTGQTAINLVAGNYTVTVTATGGGGTATAAASISQPSAIVVNTSVNGTLNCTQSPVVVTATVSGGAGSYSYAWSNGNTGNPANYQIGGSQSVTVTDANGCPKIAAFSIQTNTNQPTAVAGPSATLTCTQPTATLNGSGSSSGGTFIYAWTATGGGNIVSGATTLMPVVNAAGTYTLVVTNTTNGCTSSASTSATANTTAPTATATGGALTCTTTTVGLTVTTNASPASFAWTGPNGYSSTQQNPTVSQPGSYTVTVTSTANGCTKSATVTVTQNTTVPTVTATGGTITCANPNVVLSVTTNAQQAAFLWTGPCITASNQSQQNPAVICAGTFTVVVTNTVNGCTASATAVVTANTTPPTATATPSGPLTCTATTVQVTSTTNAPNATFAWSGPGGFTATTQNINVQNPGNYTVTITSTANGCSATAVAAVAQNTTPPTAAVSPSGPLTCTTTTVQVTSTTNASNAAFAWSGPNGFMATTQNINVQNPGIYTVTITSTANGCSATAAATVVQNTTLPTVSIAAPANLNCTLTSIQLNALASSQGGNFNYQWTTVNGNIVSGATTLTPTVNAAGSYNLLINNTTNGCTASAAVTVNQTPPVLATIANSQAVSCNGGANGSATASAASGSAPYNFIWSNGAITATANNLSAGTYTVTITDGNNCTATASATISQPAVLAANASATAQTANGVNNGTATAAPSGGTSPYVYLWSNGGATAAITGLAPGNYTVTITDAQGCTAVQTVTVNSFNCNLSATVTATNVSCNGAANGSAAVTLTGGTQPITYLWSNGAVTASISGLAVGNYTVSITDASGCPAVGSASITEPVALAANATATAVTAVNLNDGTATAQPTGGSLPYTYLWNTGATTATITALAPGSYTPTITDANGCTATQTVTVNAFNCALVTSVVTTSATCTESANGSATVVVSGGSAPYTFLWSSGDLLPTAGNLIPGLYTVTVGDGAGCVSTASTTVMALDTVSPTLACPGSIFLCGANIVTYPAPTATDNCNLNGAIPVLVSGQASGTAFDDGVTTQVFSVTDGGNNTATCSFTVTVFPVPDVLIDSVHNDLGNSGTGSISITAVGGVGPFIFIWKKDGVFFSNNEDLTGLQAGTYTLTMSDTNGCEVVLAPITVDNIVAAGEPLLQPSVRVWPNPAQTGIWLKMHDLQAFSAEILNAQGQLVQTLVPADLQEMIAVDALPQGIYYLKIVDVAGKTRVAAWVKSN